MSGRLLTRDEFRVAIFERDRHVCVVCNLPAIDAHHIIERRLWPDGGYYLDNGVSLCAEHHLEAEQTTIGCETLRTLAGIKSIVLPPHLDADESYDKWGNPILGFATGMPGMRLRGELFDDPSVQKVLAPVLHLFTNRVKYPRTYHLPWSGRISSDDRVLSGADLSSFFGELVVTAKMDGECITMYRDGMHARAITDQRSFTPDCRFRIASMHGAIAHEIPKDWRICGENLYAQHAIAYKHLSGYFQVFSVWNEQNVCLSWDDTVTWAGLLGFPTVPVLYRGPWNEPLLRKLYTPTLNGDPCEGYVVRSAGSFRYRDFRYHVAKYVHAGHEPRHGGGAVIPNELETR